MRIVELLYKVITKDLDTATAKTKELGKETKKAEREVKTLSGAFKQFSGVGGPIGEVAGRVNNIGDSAKNAAGGLRTLTAALGGIAGTVAVVTGAVVALAGAVGILAAFRFVGVLDSISKLGEEFGYSASQAALLDAKLQGRGGLAAYEKDIQRVTRALGKADEESSRANAAFAALGITVSANAKPNEVLNELVEKYGDKVKENNLTTMEQQSLQLALGQTWKETLFRQKEAADALEMYNQFAEKGLGISKKGEEATANYNDAMDGLSYMFKIVGSQLVAVVMPAFTGLINALVDSYKNGGLVAGVFKGISWATKLLMVPISILINMFISLDTVLQTITTSVSAMWDALNGKGFSFSDLKTKIANIIATGNSRLVPLLVTGEDEFGAAPGNVGGTGGANLANPGKDPKDDKKLFNGYGQENGDYVDGRLARETHKNQMQINAVYALYAEEAKKAEEATQKLMKSYVDMGNPLSGLIKQQQEIEMLMVRFPEKADLLFAAWNKVQDSINDLTDTQKKAAEQMTLLTRIGETAFQGLEDALMSFVTTGRLNFKSFISSMLQDIARLIIQMKVIQPLLAGFGAYMGGGSFVSAFMSAYSGTAVKSAKGNVFDGKMLHGFKGGIGMIGEEGPEAVMPLKRGSDGKLGIVAQGSRSSGGVQIGSIQVNVQGGNTNAETGQNVSKAIVDTMKQIAQGEIIKSRRPGGVMYA